MSEVYADREVTRPQAEGGLHRSMRVSPRAGESCGNCLYGKVAVARPGWFFCLRHPPSWSGHQATPGHVLVDTDDWCGDYASASGGTTPPAGGGGSMGVTDGSDAAPGQIGEYLTASRQSGTPISVVTGVALDIIALTLPAGDWDLQGQVGTQAASGGHIQHMMVWINQAPATPPTVFQGGFHEVGGISTGGSEQMVLPTGRLRQSLAATTTLYLSMRLTFTGTCTAYGFVGARRAR